MFMFTDAEDVYKKYKNQYKCHDNGYVILAPPASGKTYFVRQQSMDKKNWIDQDDLFEHLGVKWNDKYNTKLNYLRADYISEQTKTLGYRIIGSLFWNYRPDAIVILPLELHRKYINMRQDLDLGFVLNIRNLLINMAEKYNIPNFNNIKDAVEYLENKKKY